MTRTLAERARDPKWWGEQALHAFAIGAPPTAAVLGLHEAGFAGWQVVGGALSAFWIGSVREFDQRPVESYGDMLADLAFTTLGGALCGLVYFLTT
jgi:hypothetical protein